MQGHRRRLPARTRRATWRSRSEVHEEGRLRERQVRAATTTLLMVGDNAAAGAKTGEVVQSRAREARLQGQPTPGAARRRCTRSSARRRRRRSRSARTSAGCKDFSDPPVDARPDVQRRRTSCPRTTRTGRSSTTRAINAAMRRGDAGHRRGGAREGLGATSTRWSRAGARRRPVDLGQPGQRQVRRRQRRRSTTWNAAWDLRSRR